MKNVVLPTKKNILTDLVPSDMHLFFNQEEKVVVCVLTDVEIKVCAKVFEATPTLIDLLNAVENERWVALLRGQYDILTVVQGTERKQFTLSEFQEEDLVDAVQDVSSVATHFWRDWLLTEPLTLPAFMPLYFLQQEDYPVH